MEFMTFDCQKFSTHTRKFLLHHCNLYAHFEKLESSSLLGQWVGSGKWFSCQISCHTSTSQYYKVISTHIITFYPHHSPTNYILFSPFHRLREVKKFDQGHPELVSKRALTQIVVFLTLESVLIPGCIILADT